MTSLAHLQFVIAEKDNLIQELERDNRDYEETVQKLALQVELLSVQHDAVVARLSGTLPSSELLLQQQQSLSHVDTAHVRDLEHALRSERLRNDELHDELASHKSESAALKQQLDLTLGSVRRFMSDSSVNVGPHSPVHQAADADAGHRLHSIVEDVLFGLQKRLTRQSNECREYRENIERLNSELVRLRSENRNLSELQGLMAKQGSDSQIVKRQLDDMSVELQSLKDEKLKLTKELTKINGERDSLSQQVTSLSKEVALLSDQSSLYDTSRSAFESEIDRFRKTLQQLRAENDDLRTSSFEKDKFVADVEAQALRLKQECADHESVAQTAQRTIEELIVDCRRLEDALEDANKRCADRRLLEDRVSQLSSDNERLSSELDRLTRNYHMLSVNLEERDRSRTSLEAEIHSLRSQLHDNMDTHRMADSRMQETVGLLHNAQRELSLEKEVKQSVEGDLRDARAAIALLEAKLMACDEKISVQAQQYSERVSTLEQERDRLGTTVGALTAQLNLSQSSKEGLELTASSLRSDVSALSIQKAELDRLNRQLQHRIEVLISDNDSLQRLRMLIEEARCFDPQFASLGANDILHALVQQWQYSVDLKQEVALLSQELQSLTTDNEAKVGEITRLLSSIEELRDLRRDCETYLSMADAATAQHQKLLGEYRALSDEQDVMQQRIADLEERNMLMLEEKTRTEDELKLAHGEIAELTLQIIKWLRGSGLVQDDAEIVQRLNRQRSVSLLRSQRASSVVHGTDLASE